MLIDPASALYGCRQWNSEQGLNQEGKVIGKVVKVTSKRKFLLEVTWIALNQTDAVESHHSVTRDRGNHYGDEITFLLILRNNDFTPSLMLVS